MTPPAPSQDDLPRAVPETAGVDPADIEAFLTDLHDSGVELHHMMLFRAGAVVAEGSWWPYRPDRPHMLHSATKSFLAVAVGLAIEEGFFSLSTRVVDVFADHLAKRKDSDEEISPNLAAMTVEDLLTQTSGHGHGVSGGEWRGIKTSWVDEFFSLPVPHTPGSQFVYTSATSFMLSAVVSRTTGTTVREFLEPRLFRPLGIRLLSWDVGPDGICPGGNGISCLAADFLKLGVLHLQRGKWEGRQILPERWVAASTTGQRGNRHGYHWWTDDGGNYWASGMFGQLCIVFPRHDAVLVTTGAVPQGADRLHAVIWRHFPELFESSSSSSSTSTAASSQALTSRLSSLRLPQLTVIPNPGPATPDLQALISRERFTCPLPNADSVYSFAFDFGAAAEGTDTLTFHLQDPRGHHAVSAGLNGTTAESRTTLTGAALHHGYEPASLRAVASAGWTGPATLRLVMQYTETAFRDTFTVRFFGTRPPASLAQLDHSVSVNSFATRRPTLFGAVLRTGTELTAGPLPEELREAVAAAGRRRQLSTADSTVGELLDDPAARAVLEQEVPHLLVDARLDKARRYTFDLITRHVGLGMSDLARINEKLPALS